MALQPAALCESLWVSGSLGLWVSGSLGHLSGAALCCQEMDGPGENDPDLVASPDPRFCDAVKTDSPLYSSLFTRVFKNKTFNVYRLTKPKKKARGEGKAGNGDA